MRINKRITICLAALLAVIITTFSLFSCTFPGRGKDEYVTKDFISMSTYVTIKLSKQSKDENGKDILLEDEYMSTVMDECQAIAQSIQAEFSAHDENSIVSEVNSAADEFFDVDKELISFINRTFELSSLTAGAFDPTIGPVTLLWNITGDARVPSDEEITDALSHVGADKFEISGLDISKSDRQAKLDFGGVAKGYALEKITEYIKSTEITHGFVNFGGSVSVIGEKPDKSDYKIGITDPGDKSSVIGYVYIKSGYVSVSGNYERYAEIDGTKYDHIFDPATGRPSESDLTSVTVICADATAADALSTALYVMGSEKALEYSENASIDFEAVFTKNNGEILYTAGIKDKFAQTEKDDTETYIEFEKYSPETNGEN